MTISKKIPLDGKLTDVEIRKIQLESIVLDVDNPRIQYYLDTRLNDKISLDEIKLALAESNDQ